MRNKNARIDSNMSIIWNEIYENTYKEYLSAFSIFVAEKNKEGVAAHYVSKTFHKILCLLEVPVLSLPYVKLGLFDNNKYWDPKDGPKKFSRLIYEGFFTQTDVEKSRRLGNKYKIVVDCLAADIEKYLKSEAAFLQERITATVALWKWAEKKRKIPMDCQQISDDELEYDDLSEIIRKFIVSIREKDDIYLELPSDWYNPYELLAGMIFYALASVPLFYEKEDTDSDETGRYPVYDDNEVLLKQKEIKTKLVSYFQRQAGDKKAEEEAVNDFGIKIVETWSDKVLEIIKLSEKINVSVPDATGEHEITLHVNMQYYGEFYNRKYAKALMNHLDDEIEEILLFLQNQMEGLSRMLESLEVLRKAMQNSNNPMMIKAFVKEINESGKRFTIGTIKNNEWRNAQ